MRLFTLSLAGTFLFSPITQATDFTEIFNASGNWPADVELHDFNRDGNLDLLTVDYENIGFARSGNPATAHQYLSNGDGTFTMHDTINYTLSNRDHILADLNADGYVDLFHNRIYPGTADGSFGSGISTIDLSACGSFLVTDINTDGLNDVICSEFVTGSESQFLTYINQGVFAFERGPMLPTASTTLKKGGREIKQADLNGDGLLDVVRVNTLLESLNGGINYATAGNLISTNLSTGNGFSEPTAFTTDDLRDADNPFATNTVRSFELADTNNDGNIDLVVLVAGFRPSPDAALVVFNGDGRGSFDTQSTTTIIGHQLITSGMQVVDMDDDGNQDILISFYNDGNANPQMNLAIYHGNGDATFNEGQEIAPDLPRVEDIAIGDIDGDGLLDIAMVAGWSFGTTAVLSRNDNSSEDNSDELTSTDGNSSDNNSSDTNSGNACLYAGSDPDGDGWGWESGLSCRVTAQTLPGDGGGETNGFTFQNVSNNPPCILEDSDPDGDGWGWEDGMSCLFFGTGTITTFNVEPPACESAASDADGDGWGWENHATCVVTNP